MRPKRLKRFKVGDLVEAIVDHPDDNPHIFAGDPGVVCHILNDERIGVNWESDVDGHECDGPAGSCPDGHGWYVYAGDIDIMEEIPDIDDDSFLQAIGETK